MHEFDIARADLNLLVVLDVLLEERSVTRAAKRLHRTQSAMSHALGRLRDLLGDPILVRVGGGMRPTPRAERLAGEVSRILQTLGRVLAEEAAFEPLTSRRVFRLAGPDFVAAVLPDLLARMAASAPRASVELVQAVPGMFRDVADGRADLAIARASAERADGLFEAPLATLDWAVFARAGHPAAASWDTGAWASYPHVRVRTSSGGESPVDDAARALGLARRHGPWLPHFLLAPPLLAQTDLLMTVPRAILAELAPRFGLITLPCPVELAPIKLSLYRSAQLERDPAIGWFRAQVEAAATSVFGGPNDTFASTRGARHRKKRA
jgi:DNA-binding transcriptional LysR family regulator